MSKIYSLLLFGLLSLNVFAQPANDNFASAIDVSGIINSCSSDEAYTTVDATPDLNRGSCWNNLGPDNNIWFKFQAVDPLVSVKVDIGSGKGTQTRTQLALWEADGTTQISCNRYLNDGDDVSLNASTLVIGNWYYISVDVQQPSRAGTFTLCIDNPVDYDWFEGAIDVSSIINSCSADEAYTTVDATPDLNRGSCWNNLGPDNNRWFKFQAVDPLVSVKVDIGSGKGTQTRTQLALWEADGTTQISCNRYLNDGDDVSLNASTLVIGNWYYISVDVQQPSRAGTFTLCIDNPLDYDWYDGAQQLFDVTNWCSADEAYTTVDATPDLSRGSCWNNAGPDNNRWFKFHAIHSDVTIMVDIGSGKGTQTRTQLALWEADGTTEVDCNRYSFDGEDVSITNTSLVIGNTYYISVDVQTPSRAGTFSLCVNNAKEAYYSLATGNWNIPSNWSKFSHVGIASATSPSTSDEVYIEGHTITVSGTEACAELNMTVATAHTDLIVDGGTLSIDGGELILTNPGNNFRGNITVQNGGTLDAVGDLTLTRTGGNDNFGINITGTASNISVGNDLTINSNGGTINQNLLTIDNTSSLLVTNDFNLDYSGGMKIKTSLTNDATLTVGRDINFIATSDNLTEIELNNNSILNIARNFVRGTPKYGLLTSNDASTVVYNGTVQQNIAQSAGSGTGDVFSYQNITINNTYPLIPQLITEGEIQIPGTLTLTDGIIKTSSPNLLTINAGGAISGGSINSFIDGPISKIGNTSFTFPIGNNGYYNPLGISAPSLLTDEFKAKYNRLTPSNRSSLDASIDHVSSLDVWDLQRVNGTSSLFVTLYWNSSDHGVTSLADLAVAHYDGGTNKWENMGGLAAGGASAGSILSTVPFSTFSPITLASKNGVNPLPIKLFSFTANTNDNSVEIEWITSSEINNDYFTVERSNNGSEWEAINKIKGAGNSNTTLKYFDIDNQPLPGISYYRLKQTDFNGDYSYSEITMVNFKQKDEIVIYPNPVKDNLTIANLCENCIVKIYSSFGTLVYTGSEQKINTQTWKNGIYQVVINNNGIIQSNTIIK
jgi:hypothetical protein